MHLYSLIKTQLIILLCITLCVTDQIETRCLNLLEKDGKCTKCPLTKFLYKGDCYNKIRGCDEYFSEKVCLSCQPGYVFNEGACIKEAIFFKLQKGDIPPTKINIEGELTLADIEERIGDSRKGIFETINRYFKEKYVKNLSSCSISNVKYIETINGANFIIYYRSTMKIYQAVGFIDSKSDSNRKKTVTELEFTQKTSVPSYSLEEINAGLIKHYENTLKDFLLSKIQKLTDNRYKISYVNSKGVKYESLFTKQPFQEIFDLKKVDNPFDMEDILAYIFSLYPDLKSLDFQVVSAPFFDSNSTEGTYVLVFGGKVEIKISLTKGVFDLLSYKNLQLEGQEKELKPQNPKAALNPTNYQSFEDLTDPIFLQVWKHLITQFPKYEKYEIISVKYQIAAGKNFLIKFKSPKQIVPAQTVKALISYSLTGPMQLSSLEVSGETINLNTKDYKEAKDQPGNLSKTSQTENYDYKKDPEFAEAYKFLLSDLKIVNTLPIIKVKKLESQENIVYEIIYSDVEKAKLQKYKINNKNLRKDGKTYEVMYYLVDGTDLVSGKKTPQTKKTIISFLKSQKPDLFKNLVLNKFKDTSNGYETNALSPTGIYKAEITTKGVDLQLNSLVMVSQFNCYEFTEEEYSNSSEVSKVDEFLKTSYDLTGSVMQLFQIQIKDESKRYRVIYTDKNSKKLEIVLDNLSEKFVVVQNLVLEQGYVPVQAGDQRFIGVEAISRVRFGEFIKSCEIALRLNNQTHFKIFYTCPSKAFEYMIDTSTKTDKLQIIYQASNASQSENQNKNTLDLKEAIQDQKFIELDNMIRKKFVEYVQTNQVTQVERQELTDNENKKYLSYKIYYKSSLGHYICEVTWMNGDIRILNFFLTTSQTNENCQVLDEKTNVCIKCLEYNLLEFGKCHEKIDFCVTQMGNVCVQCDKRTILRGGKCLRSCEEAFKLREVKSLDE